MSPWLESRVWASCPGRKHGHPTLEANLLQYENDHSDTLCHEVWTRAHCSMWALLILWVAWDRGHGVQRSAARARTAQKGLASPGMYTYVLGTRVFDTLYDV